MTEKLFTGTLSIKPNQNYLTSGPDISTIYVHGWNLGHVIKIHINSGEKLIQACEKPYIRACEKPYTGLVRN